MRRPAIERSPWFWLTKKPREIIPLFLSKGISAYFEVNCIHFTELHRLASSSAEAPGKLSNIAVATFLASKLVLPLSAAAENGPGKEENGISGERINFTIVVVYSSCSIHDYGCSTINAEEEVVCNGAGHEKRSVRHSNIFKKNTRKQ